MRKEFNIYNEINKLLNNKESNIKKYYYEYNILDNKDNEEVLRDILTRKERNLMISKAGSGKTYSLLKVASKLDELTVLSVPNRSQALQIKQEYNAKGIKCEAIVGDVKVSEVDGTNNLLIVVYDKLIEVLNYFKVDNLIIDEAHNLVLATYRKILDNIEENFTSNNILYLTATPNSLMYLAFDNVFEFEQRVPSVYPENYRIIKYKESLNKSLLDIILDNISNGKKTLIRLNDKETTRKIKEALENLNHKVGFINSNEKGFYIDEDTEEIVYYNELTNSVINKSILPNCDAYFTTCILDQGINITSIDGADLKDLEVIYCIKNAKDCMIDNIIQLESRVRSSYYRFSILVKETEEDRNFKDLFNLFGFYYTKLLRKKSDLEADIKEYQKLSFSKNEIFEDIKAQLNYKDLNKEVSSYNDAISVDEDLNVIINLKRFCLFVYLKFNQQFYYSPDKLKELFNHSFIENTISEIKNNISLNDDRTTIKAKFIESLTNEEALKSKELVNTKELKKYYELLDYNFSKEEVVDIITTKTTRQITQLENEKLTEEIKDIGIEDLAFLVRYLENTEDYESSNLRKLNLLTYKIKNSTYYKYFKEVIKKGFDLTFILNNIENLEDIKTYLENQQYIENNKRYLEGKRLVGTASKEQLFIIENIGNYKDTIIKDLDKKVNNLNKLLSKEFNSNYNNNNLVEILHKIFNINEMIDDKTGLMKYRIRGLKLK